MAQPSTTRDSHYTWADYQTWDDDQRWEIIGGDAYLMSSPTTRHQRVIGELHAAMHSHFRVKSCQLFLSPMDVVLSDEDVVQPDLLVVCDPQRVQRTHIAGAPTLVVEVLSESSTSRDRLLKLDLYARTGVKEYWIVTPWPSLVEILVLEGNRYVVHKVFGKEQTLVSATFPDLKIDLAGVFDFPLEPGEEPPVVREPPAPAYRAGR